MIGIVLITYKKNLTSSYKILRIGNFLFYWLVFESAKAEKTLVVDSFVFVVVACLNLLTLVVADFSAEFAR